MLVRCGQRMLELAAERRRDHARRRVGPSAQRTDRGRARRRARAARRRPRTPGARAGRRAARSAELASGERIEVFANLAGTAAEARLAMAQGAEGCGLLRTEFLFLDREHRARRSRTAAPATSRCADLLGARPLVIRTLDIGGDKPIAYLPLPPEDNPALGLRGIRTSLWRPESARHAAARLAGGAARRCASCCP